MVIIKGISELRTTYYKSKIRTTFRNIFHNRGIKYIENLQL